MLPKQVSNFWRGLAALSILAMGAVNGFAQSKNPENLAPTPVAPSAKIEKAAKQEVLTRINDIVEKTAFVPGIDFKKWPNFLTAQQQEIDKAETNSQFSAAVNKALHQFGFSHMVLITPEAAQARISRQSVGIGVLIQADPDGMRIVNVFPDTPAEAAGLVAGDLIVEGNGKKPETPADLLGEDGSQLTIKVLHANGKTQKYTLTRKKYKNVRPETLTWAKPDTAVLKVNTFDLSYDRDNVEKLMKQAAGAKNLIVDLRSNPGGAILNLTHLMGLLLPPGTPLGTFISRYTYDRYTQEQKGKPTNIETIAKWSPSKLRAAKDDLPPYTGHVAVLVNGGSGSAAEIAAAALHDQIEAPIVGTKSAGAVLVSVMAPLPDGFVLQYPITDFVTNNGVRLEGNGVSPDVEAPAAAKFNEPDTAIEKATMLLQRAAAHDSKAVARG